MKITISRSGIAFVPYAAGEWRQSFLRAMRVIAVSYASFVVAQTILVFFFDWLI